MSLRFALQRRQQADAPSPSCALSSYTDRELSPDAIKSTNHTLVHASQPIVYVVDDDPSIRAALDSLFRAMDFQVATFKSTAEFLSYARPRAPNCLVLDIRMPGANGLALQTHLAANGVEIPIVFLTAHGDIQMSVQAMKEGAVDFLTKPFREQDLLDAVGAAIERDRQRLEDELSSSTLRLRFSSLSLRERQIMSLVTAGLMNKEAATKVGLSEITVKIHRSNVMKKMGAKSLAQLVRMADALRLYDEK
jgi:FixJ family two-component response regulator